MPVNGVPWSLVNKVLQAPKCPGTLSARVPLISWVPECLEHPSVFNGRIPEYLQSTYRVPKWDKILDICLSE